MTHEGIALTKKEGDMSHVLIGRITNVSGKEINYAEFGNIDDMPTLGHCHVDIDEYDEVKNIPIFYHCENTEKINAVGGGFSIYDSVLVINYGDSETLDATKMKVVGFSDGLPRECNCDTNAKIRIHNYWSSSAWYDYEEGQVLGRTVWVSLYVEIGDTGVFPPLLDEACRGINGLAGGAETTSPQSGGGYPCLYFYVDTETYGGYFWDYETGDYFLGSQMVGDETVRTVQYCTPIVGDECIRTIPIELRCKIGANTEDYVIIDTVNIRVKSPYWGRYRIYHDAPCSNVTGRRIYYDEYDCEDRHVSVGFILEPGTQVWYSGWLKTYQKICPYNEIPVLISTLL